MQLSLSLQYVFPYHPQRVGQCKIFSFHFSHPRKNNGIIKQKYAHFAIDSS